jgi:hypothetical protein
MYCDYFKRNIQNQFHRAGALFEDPEVASPTFHRIAHFFGILAAVCLFSQQMALQLLYGKNWPFWLILFKRTKV